MLRGAALASFRKKLLAWFDFSQRDLPWRRTRNPYHIWISEIMLQQTRVTAVIPYFERFLDRFPTAHALASAPEEEVLRLWSGLGYYSRARNLQKAAREIVAKHGGEFPRDPARALALPGIGSYTRAAILSIAYGEKLAVLDGNVARVLSRLGAIRGDLRDAKRWRELQTSADAFLDPNRPGDWNQAMMELGATICTPANPRCLLCPVAASCQARKQGLMDVLPEKRKKRPTVPIRLAALVLLDSKGNTLLLPPPSKREKRAADVATLVSQMWHFPTIEDDEDAAQRLRSYFEREVLRRGKLSATLTASKEVRHAVTYRAIRIAPYFARLTRLPAVDGARVVPLADLSSIAISNLTRKIARSVLEATRATR